MSETCAIRRVLLLGDSGFIGSHVASRLQSRVGELEVVGRSADALDLTRAEDAERLGEHLDPHTAVVVCAGIKRQLGDTLDTCSLNLRMALNLCRLLAAHPVARVVFLSSTAVYGEEIHNLQITETTPVRPTSHYGTAKYASERLLANTLRAWPESSLLVLRPPLTYGPRDSGSAYGPSSFVSAALAGQTVTLWGDGSELREFLFVEDLAEILCRLALSSVVGELDVVSGRSYSYLDALSAVASVLGTPVRSAPRPRTRPKVDHGYSNAALRAALGGFSFTSLRDGIRRTIAARPDAPSGIAGGCGDR